MKPITIPGKETRIGTAKDAFLEKLKKQDPELAKSFEGMTPQQRTAGKLIGKLIMARKDRDVDDAFTWYEQEPGGEKSDYFKKMMAIYVAIEHVGANDQGTYNACRKILLQVNRK